MKNGCQDLPDKYPPLPCWCVTILHDICSTQPTHISVLPQSPWTFWSFCFLGHHSSQAPHLPVSFPVPKCALLPTRNDQGDGLCASGRHKTVLCPWDPPGSTGNTRHVNFTKTSLLHLLMQPGTSSVCRPSNPYTRDLTTTSCISVFS